MDEQPAIVIDNGSLTTKCGFSGDDIPKAILPTVVGRPPNPGILIGMATKDCFVGDEVYSKCGILRCHFPILNGVISNWNDISWVWHHTFYNELRVNPEEHFVVLTDAIGNTMEGREKMVDVMFEKTKPKGVFIGLQALLTLISHNKTSGCVLEMGDGVTQCVPIIDGVALSSNHEEKRCCSPTGRDCSEYLKNILSQIGYDLRTSAEFEIVRDIKETMGYIAHDYEEELKKTKKSNKITKNRKEYNLVDYSILYSPEQWFQDVKKGLRNHEKERYELPDGSEMMIDSEKYRCNEILFSPSLLNDNKRELCGIHELVYNSINNCCSESSSEERNLMFENIVLGGGGSMIPGIERRLENEIRRLNRQRVKYVDVLSHQGSSDMSDQKRFSAWIGGSILSSLSSFQEHMFGTLEEFRESGSHIMVRKKMPMTNIQEEGNWKKYVISSFKNVGGKEDLRERLMYVKNSFQEEEEGYLQNNEDNNVLKFHSCNFEFFVSKWLIL